MCNTPSEKTRLRVGEREGDSLSVAWQGSLIPAPLVHGPQQKRPHRVIEDREKESDARA